MQLTAGFVSEIFIPLSITNDGDDAYAAQLSFTLPTGQLEFVRVDPRNVSETNRIATDYTLPGEDSENSLECTCMHTCMYIYVHVHNCTVCVSICVRHVCVCVCTA